VSGKAYANRIFTLAATLCASLVLLVACIAGADAVWVVGDDPRAVLHDGESLPVFDTSAEAEIVYDEATSCILVEIGGETVVPLWPDGVQPRSVGGKPGVEVPGSGFLAQGALVEVHGSVSGALDGSKYQAAAACWPDGHQAIVIGSVFASL
jgi:hypothetical protein